MNEVERVLEYADMLYNTAFKKTNDVDRANDLVQETFLYALKAIHKGTKIENLQAYLLQILNHKHNGELREKYRMPMVSNDKFIMEMIEENNYEMTEAQEQKTEEILTSIRRELAFLTKIHREVLVLYYKHRKSIEEIAATLNIEEGTVKSRLGRGRDKVKKGIISQKSYPETSYDPDNLLLFMAGQPGFDNEPLTVVSNSIDQNILILAYDDPLSTKSLSEKIGVPLVFIEEAVNKLTYNQLLKKTGTKFFTDFLIVDEDVYSKKMEAQKKFVDNYFNVTKDAFTNLIHDIKELRFLNKFVDTQLYLYVLYILSTNLFSFLIQELNLIKSSEFPDRPNGGKWLIVFGKKVNPFYSQNWGFTRSLEEVFTRNNSVEITLFLWDNFLSRTPRHDAFQTNQQDVNQLLYDIHNGYKINELYKSLIPNLIKLGFVNINNKNEMELYFPFLSQHEYDTISKLLFEFSIIYYDKMKDKILQFVKDNTIVYPERIDPISRHTHLLCLVGIAFSYAYKFAEEGIIEIDQNKNYPVAIMVEKKL